MLKRQSLHHHRQVGGLLVFYCLLSGVASSALHSYAAQGCGVVSLAEGAAVPLMQRLLLVRAGIWNFAMVPAIACLLFTKDTMGPFTSNN